MILKYYMICAVFGSDAGVIFFYTPLIQMGWSGQAFLFVLEGRGPFTMGGARG
jgi:hypothetical protein